MKIQLSTALLIFGLVAVCAGWIVDRQRWHSEREALHSSRTVRDEKILTGSVVFGRITAAFQIFDELKGDTTYREYVQAGCVSKLLEILEHKDKIEFSSGLVTDFDARCLSRDALEYMECNDTEHFFKIAKSLEEYNRSEYYPELYDTDSEEFHALKEFVSDTLKFRDLKTPQNQLRQITK